MMLRESFNLTLDLPESAPRNISLDPGAILLGGFARAQEIELLAALAGVLDISPFRRMVTPGGGPMSVAMTNCGDAGWVTDRTGYRYDSIDPETGQRWPKMPDIFVALATQAAESAGLLSRTILMLVVFSLSSAASTVSFWFPPTPFRQNPRRDAPPPGCPDQDADGILMQVLPQIFVGAAIWYMVRPLGLPLTGANQAVAFNNLETSCGLIGSKKTAYFSVHACTKREA
jgi:hypothetical protein